MFLFLWISGAYATSSFKESGQSFTRCAYVVSNDTESFQAFLRQILKDDASDWETDVEVVRLKAEAIASNNFTTRKDGINTIVSSSSGESSFTFRVGNSSDADFLIKFSTRALALIDKWKPKEIYPDWASYDPTQKATMNARAIPFRDDFSMEMEGPIPRSVSKLVCLGFREVVIVLFVLADETTDEFA